MHPLQSAKKKINEMFAKFIYWGDDGVAALEHDWHDLNAALGGFRPMPDHWAETLHEIAQYVDAFDCPATAEAYSVINDTSINLSKSS